MEQNGDWRQIKQLKNHESVQPLKELEWLAQYFKEHYREDLAQQIYQQLNVLQNKGQISPSDN